MCPEGTSAAATRTAEAPATRRTRILMHCPDITLKGKNQKDFRNALIANVRHVLQQQNMDWRVGAARGHLHVDSGGREDREVEDAMHALSAVAGVSSLAHCEWMSPREVAGAAGGIDWTPVENAVVDQARDHLVPGGTFAVRVNRVDKQIAASSQALQARFGAAVIGRTGWQRVRLREPDRTLHVDIYPEGIYIYADRRRGPGGLPVGTGGRVLSLLSGGIDSPVAAFMLAKRGCNVDFFHMSASHPRENEIVDSVIGRLARSVSRFSLRSRLYVAPYTHFDLKAARGRSGYELILFRRFLMRCAERLAGDIRASALVAGDSLGQVASQTMENLVAASAPLGLPVFRPLIGLNKQEIIETARRIGTYETSIEPYKDCCALIARNPRTRSRDSRLSELETALIPDYEALLRATLDDMVCLGFDSGHATGPVETKGR